jgi:hypothetical protein
MVLLREHKVFMVEAYFRNGTKVDGNWEYSVSACFEEFQERFPIVAIVYEQFRQTLHLCLNNFRESGTIGRKEGSGQVKKRTQEVIENVQQIMEDSPTTSIRHLSQQVDLSVGTCQKILKEDLHLFPYRLAAVQELHVNDLPQRLNYCQWFLNTIADDVLEKTFFTDEAYFRLSGYVNSQNMRMWSLQNPHFFTEAPHYPQKIGVWAAISQRRIIGPYFFQEKNNMAYNILLCNMSFLFCKFLQRAAKWFTNLSKKRFLDFAHRRSPRLARHWLNSQTNVITDYTHLHNSRRLKTKNKMFVKAVAMVFAS